MSIPVAPRRQQAEERREQILDAALHSFSQKGFAGASIRDIAREAGITEGLIYHYFESKEKLQEACWKERSWHSHVERILSTADGKPVEQVLREIVADFLDTLREHGPNIRMCVAEMQRNADMAAEHVERIEQTSGLIKSFLRSRQDVGELRAGVEVGTAAGLLLGCANSLFLIWGDTDAERWNRMSRDLVEHGVDTVLHGISA
jgi:AcrR family transcriptional regulator